MELNTTNILIRQGEQGLTNTALAARCGISRQNISTIIRRGTCHPVTAAKLAKALGVPVADIIEKGGVSHAGRNPDRAGGGEVAESV